MRNLERRVFGLILVILSVRANAAPLQLQSALSESDAEPLDVVELPETILREAVAGWKRIGAVMEGCHGTAYLLEEKHKQGVTNTLQSADLEFWVTKKWKRVDFRSRINEETVAYSLNSEFAFKAVATRPNSAFFVTHVEKSADAYWAGLSDGFPGKIESAFHSQFREFAHAGWQMYGTALPELVASEGFKLKTYRAYGNDDQKRVEITFAWNPPNKELTSCDDITVILIPAMDYAIEQYRCKYGQAMVSLEAIYSLVNKVPVPKVVTRTLSDERSPGTSRVARFTMKEFEDKAYPEDTFKASAFGLPELKVNKIGGSRSKLVLLINIVFVMAVVLCWWFVRRKTKRDAANSDGGS